MIKSLEIKKRTLSLKVQVSKWYKAGRFFIGAIDRECTTRPVSTYVISIHAMRPVPMVLILVVVEYPFG
jgi:hypothetical protein